MTLSKLLKISMTVSLLIPLYAFSASTKYTFEADSFCPFNCLADGGGFTVEILKIALKKHDANAELVYQEIPWTRAIQNAEAGKTDGIIGGTGFSEETAEPKGFTFHKLPVGKTNLVFAAAKGVKWKYENPESFKNQKIGFVLGYDQAFSGPIGDYLKENLKNTALVDIATGETAGITNLKKLTAGRITLVLEDESVLKYLLKKNGLEGQVEIVQNMDKPMNFYIGFSPKKEKSAELSKQLDATISELRKSGELAKILSKYGVTDWN